MLTEAAPVITAALFAVFVCSLLIPAPLIYNLRKQKKEDTPGC